MGDVGESGGRPFILCLRESGGLPRSQRGLLALLTSGTAVASPVGTWVAQSANPFMMKR